jgi:signal transduction histidine kinase
VPDVIVDVVRACLENVLRHSGTNIAELDLGATEDVVSIVVTDNGTGFDPSMIAEDRLGLRASVIERIRSIGGTARIWSTPGEGTSIVMEVPIEEFVASDEEAMRGRA